MNKKYTISLFVVFLLATLQIYAQQDSLKTWRRVTFPGPRHKASPEYPPYQGSDRSEFMTYFKVSPADPDFMLAGHNMSGSFYSADGREFKPVDLPLHRFSINAGFSPHDGNTGFLLHGHSSSKLVNAYPTESVLPGIWRTKDKGQTWEQIYKMHPQAPNCKLYTGKQPILVDPHPDRSGHIYYGSHHLGLLRSIDDGSTWQTAAFSDHPIKTLDAVVGPGDTTILYVVVGETGKYGPRGLIEEGKLYRVEIAPDSPYGVRVFELPWKGDFVDVSVAQDDWTKGMVIRNNDWDRGGGTDLLRFSDGAAVLGPARTASQAGVKAFMDVHINPQNADHVVVRCHGAGLAYVLQYSINGGVNWNSPLNVVNGHIPSMISYNPASHKYPEGAMPDEFHQGQGPAVGFDANDSSVVYWWTQNFNKTLLKSTDHGATWEPFSYGGPFKQATQIAVAPDGKHMGVGRAEYGFVTTRDGGLSWIGSTNANDPVLEGITSSQPSSADSKYGRGLAYNPGDPDIMVGLYGLPSVLVISRNGGISWENTMVSAKDRGCVYWSVANPAVVYAANQRSTDTAMTWNAMDRYVLALSKTNENFLVGNRSSGDSQLSLSIDGGVNWTVLPEVPMEKLPGTSTYKAPIHPAIGTHQPIEDAVAIDPSPEYNPANPDNEGIRILAAGRSGVYEYRGQPGDPFNGSWSVLNTGFEPSIHFSRIEPVPWIAHVSFDPRPGMEHVVYACASADPDLTGQWRSGNPNMVHSNGQARRPFYRSMDGGQTWVSLHAPEYNGIPDHLDVTSMAVGPDGTLFADGYAGLYVLPGVPDTSSNVGQNSIQYASELNIRNFPNPFTHGTNIQYYLPERSVIRISILDVTGNEVKRLIDNEMQSPGRHNISFEAGDLPAGLYSGRLIAGDQLAITKILIIN